jgi:hypothetical protein
MSYYDTQFAYIHSKLHLNNSCPNCKCSWNTIEKINSYSIKQRKQLNIEKMNIQEIYSMGKLEGFQCLNCLIIYPKTSFLESNPTNNLITIFSFLHLDQN